MRGRLIHLNIGRSWSHNIRDEGQIDKPDIVVGFTYTFSISASSLML
jgi:hypothetical protein